MTHPLSARLSRSFHRALDLAYPPLCLHCSDHVSPPGEGAPEPLCRSCREDCVPLSRIACRHCGRPSLSEHSEPVESCAGCLKEPPPFQVARSAFWYRESGPIRSLILRLKHAADATVAQSLALDLLIPVRDVASYLHEPLLCPVPLHWWRRLRRGYNQAALLARHLARQSGLPVCHALVRPRATQPQKGNRSERLQAMQGTFRVRSGNSVQGRCLILVDDVLTTGSTVSGCARALLEAGAATVGVVTLARAVRWEE